MYFDYFGIEYIPQEVLSKIKYKSITYDIFRIQDDDFIMKKKLRLYQFIFSEWL